MVLPTMSLWAAKKGLDLLATADWTHPLWFKELESQLEEDSEGIYKVNPPSLKASEGQGDDLNKTRFILSTEMANIYTDKGKGRRIHTLFFAPSLAVVAKINTEIKKRGGNLMSDGRPILGFNLEEMCELVWGVDERVMVIPAHAWTPWFSMFGSKSGFDSIEECFGKYAAKIYSVETGLSSDVLMNWKIKDLETRTIISNSDSHSPRKMGREATVLELGQKKYSFADVVQALKMGVSETNKIAYTIEFHPEEGKYHYTGHRVCKVVQSPEETRQKGAICHVCGRPLTVGVEHRVEELAAYHDLKPVEKMNENGVKGYFHPTDKTRPPYVMLVPLQEIIAESIGVGTASKKVDELYEKMISGLGNELKILLKTDLKIIAAVGGEKVAEGIKKVRSGDMVVEPGYDGVFGVVKIWASQKETNGDKLISDQTSLF